MGACACHISILNSVVLALLMKEKRSTFFQGPFTPSKQTFHCLQPELGHV
jgi:hypothetical protein